MYDKIQACLDISLNLAFPNTPIAWENTSFNTPEKSLWLRPRFMPIDRRPSAMGQVPNTNVPVLQRYNGIYQVIIATPEDSGIKEANDAFNTLLSRFEATSDLGPVSNIYVTIKQIEKMRAYSESPWYKTPVNIHWYTYIKG